MAKVSSAADVRSPCPKCGLGASVTVREAARRLKVSHQSVRLWIAEGRFPNALAETIPGGHRWWIPLEDLEAFRKSRATGKRRRTA